MGLSVPAQIEEMSQAMIRLVLLLKLIYLLK
jgi:hypothetical protein